LADNRENYDEEISILFDKAIDEIDKINPPDDEKKKEIVLRLPQDLEGWIQTDRICMEIVKRLKSKIHDTLIRDWLPKEYKQEYRRKNALRQNKILKDLSSEPQSALNKQHDKEVKVECKKQKNKAVVMVDTDGSSHIQSDEYTGLLSSDAPSSITIDKTFNNRLYQSLQWQEQPSKFEISNEDKKASRAISEQSLDKDILSFEFPLDCCRYLQSHLNSDKSNADDKVWFNGVLYLKTGEVISAYIGKQENIAEKSSSMLSATGLQLEG
jgi:hypothetical protein